MAKLQIKRTNGMQNTHDNDELQAWLRLSLEPNIGQAKVRLLLSVFGLPQNIYHASTGSLAAYIDPNLATQMRKPPTPELQVAIDHTMAWVKKIITIFYA